MTHTRPATGTVFDIDGEKDVRWPRCLPAHATRRGRRRRQAMGRLRLLCRLSGRCQSMNTTLAARVFQWQESVTFVCLVSRINELTPKFFTRLFADATERIVDFTPTAPDDEVRIEHGINRNAGILAEFSSVSVATGRPRRRSQGWCPGGFLDNGHAHPDVVPGDVPDHKVLSEAQRTVIGRSDSVVYFCDGAKIQSTHRSVLPDP